MAKTPPPAKPPRPKPATRPLTVPPGADLRAVAWLVRLLRQGDKRK
jgi:hypothetical protein